MKKIIPTIALIGVLTLGGSVLYLNAKQNDRFSILRAGINGRGEENVLTLDSTSYVVSSTYTNGSFSVQTPSGNNVQFSYDNGKSNANGLITLNKFYPANAVSDYCYIGNEDPITSVSSISIDFDGGILDVFASNDKTSFYKVDVLTSSGSTVLGNGYLYYRFVNSNHTETAINLNSLSFVYECIESEYTSETSDISNDYALNGAAAIAGGVAIDTSTHYSAFNDSQSLKFTSPITTGEDTYVMGDSTSYRWQFGISLPRAMKGSELYSMKLSMMVNSELTSKGDDKVVELRIYPSQKYWAYANSSLCVRVYPSAGKTGWYSLSVNFSSSSKSLLDDEFIDMDFSYLFIRPNHVAPVADASEGYLFVDEMRIEYIHDYPTFDSSAIDSSAQEINDISNNAFVNGYSSSDGDLSYIQRSQNSYRSRAVTPTADTCRFHYNGFLVDMGGKTISFDAKLATSSVYLKIDFFHNDGGTDYRYEVTARYGTEAGVTIESYTGDYAGWKHYTIDFDVAMTSASKSARPQSVPENFGFVIAHSINQVCYIDNIYIS